MSNGPATLMVPPSEQLFGLLVDGMKRANDRVDEERVAREAALGRLYDKVDHGFTNLRAHIDAQHAETQERLRQVCDKGGLEHDRFIQNDLERKAEIIELRHRLDRAAAMEDGRKQVRGSMLRAGAWVIENGKGIAAVAASMMLGVGIGSVSFGDRESTATAAPMAQQVQAVSIPPVTNQQGTLTQSHVEDWPLRTN